MKIACLSGKGGAGKTFVAVNLAYAAQNATYIDCDVEEPNGRLFLKPEDVKTESVGTLLPVFDGDKCNGCRKCVEFCRFHALVYVKEKPVVFSEVCHSCGGCVLVCPEGAVSEEVRAIGSMQTGKSGDITVITGILNPGEASGVEIIRTVLKKAGDMTVIDCPPGSACSVMESVADADYCILVAEPTAFGMHNFRMVHELVNILGKKCGVIINKQDEPYEELEEFCRQNALPVLARIPYDKDIAAVCAKGGIVSRDDENILAMFREILSKIGGQV